MTVTAAPDVLALVDETQTAISSPPERTVAAFDRWLFLPDKTALLGVLAAIAANLESGDPVWLMLVGPPG